MSPPGVVKLEVLGQSSSQLRSSLVGPQVNILLLHTAPQVPLPELWNVIGRHFVIRINCVQCAPGLLIPILHRLARGFEGDLVQLWEMWMGALIAFSSCAAAAASVEVSRVECDIEQRASAGEFMGGVLVTAAARSSSTKVTGMPILRRKYLTVQTRNIVWCP